MFGRIPGTGLRLRHSATQISPSLADFDHWHRAGGHSLAFSRADSLGYIGFSDPASDENPHFLWAQSPFRQDVYDAISVTALFGPTNEHATRPMGDAHVVLTNEVWCRPCMLRECPLDHRCMLGIHVPRVRDAARRTL